MEHFEHLWQKCEALHKEEHNNDVSAALNELSIKLALYKNIDSKEEIPKEDAKKIRSRLLGEILLSLTNISLIDDINVFSALRSAMQFRLVETLTSND